MLATAFVPFHYGHGKTYDAKLECLIEQAKVTVDFNMDTSIPEYDLVSFDESDCRSQLPPSDGLVTIDNLPPDSYHIIYKKIFVFYNEFNDYNIRACLSNGTEAVSIQFASESGYEANINISAPSSLPNGFDGYNVPTGTLVTDLAHQGDGHCELVY